MAESPEQPPFMLMIDPYFAVYNSRRRALLSGEAPSGATGAQPPRARVWRTHQNRLSKTPAWEEAERYRRLMQEGGYQSIRALAEAISEDHSRIARLLKVLELPADVLAALREHSADVHVRGHLTERRLRRMATKTCCCHHSYGPVSKGALYP
jgi:hypothetical protein